MDDRLAVIEKIVSCMNCDLQANCRAPVPMRGRPARIAIVGEAPGEQEDHEGRPFIGPAGRRLRSILNDAGITEPLGVLNTVSCFPHGSPPAQSVIACDDNKWTQISYLNPKYLLLLGRVALKAMRADLDLRHGRARPFLVRDRLCFCTYHPAAALRSGKFDTEMRRDLERFRHFIDAEDWMSFIPDNCAACVAPALWYETSGLGWCPMHLPRSEAAAYEGRQALLDAELERVRKVLA